MIFNALPIATDSLCLFDAHFASQTAFGKPLVNSCFTLALVTGLSVADISQNAVNLECEEIHLPAPVFEGDSVYARSEY
jgi:itaconyl-CoA hydratase